MYSRSFLFLFVFLSFVTSSFAQNIGINSTASTPNNAAMLDIDGVSGLTVPKGLLIPRMTDAQKQAITLTAPANGLLIYQTDGIEGIWCNRSTSNLPVWEFVGGSPVEWKLSGNTGTTAGTDFIGTTDGVDLVFKTNSTENLRLQYTTGFIGMGTSTPASYLTVQPFTNGIGSAIDGIRIYHPNSTETQNDGVLLGIDMSLGTTATLMNYENDDLVLGTYGTESIRIKPSSQVCIGVSNPLSTLHIQDNIGVQPGLTVTSATQAPGSGGMLFGLNTGSQTIGRIWNSLNAGIEFGTNNTDRMFLDASGNLGIGLTSPASKLHVADYFNECDIELTSTYSRPSTIYYSDDANGVEVYTTRPMNSRDFVIGTADAGNVLSVHQGGAVTMVGGATGVTPFSGSGTRLMWIPAKSAFRAGVVTGSQWNDANIGDRSIALGEDVIASGSNSVALGKNCMANGTNSIALGTNSSTGGFNGSIVISDNSTTSVLAASAANQFMVRADGGYILYADNAFLSGVTLSPGAGAWASVSDKRKKENFVQIDPEETLIKIKDIEVTEWNYRSQDRSVRHIGPMAQDFYNKFMLGGAGNDTTITSSDISGVNMLAIKALEERTSQLKEKTREVEALRNELDQLKAIVSKQTQLIREVKELVIAQKNEASANKISEK